MSYPSPGQWVCRSCGFHRINRSLNMAAGTVTTNAKLERFVCPNDGSVLDQYTEADAIETLRGANDRLFEENEKLSHQLLVMSQSPEGAVQALRYFVELSKTSPCIDTDQLQEATAACEFAIRVLQQAPEDVLGGT